jgi:PAS domain S-box-containing protein
MPEIILSKERGSVMKNEENQRISKINECFLNFTADPDRNIQLLTICCGMLMGADAALYNRMQDCMLHTLAQWNAPPDFNPVDRPDGHICHDVIKNGGKALHVIRNLHQTGYAESDPNVSAYGLKTYIGAPVSCNNRCVGSLCVVYQRDYSPDEEEKRLLQILAAALGVEEERREEIEDLHTAKKELETRVRERTADLARANEQLLIDITERKQVAEALLEKNEKFHAITDTTSDAIVMMDEDGKISFWNPAAERIFGYSAVEALGKDLHTFLTPVRYHELYKEGLTHFKATGEGNAVGKTLEFDAVRKDGGEFPLELSLSAFRIRDKCHAAGILRDITGRKAAEMELVRTNRELEKRTGELLETQEELVRNEKLAAIGRLAGSVGHELRNPLGVMNNAVYFLKTVMTDVDETVKEYLDIIKHEIDCSQRIITDLLDFARTKSPQKMAVMVRDLMEESLAKCLLPENVDVQSDIADKLPLLNVDPLQMGQVFQNLIDNAVQAMPGGGTLRISVKKVRGTRKEEQGTAENNLVPLSSYLVPDADFIEIRVADTGTGISRENMTKLFQPLFSTKARGIGLGLTVCKNLTEANGGRIAVESELGKGTTFTVILPIEGL